MGTLERELSIEVEPQMVDLVEPQTLNYAQMKRAREEALCILKVLGPEEALKIFTQGYSAPKLDEVDQVEEVDQVDQAGKIDEITEVSTAPELEEESKQSETDAVISPLPSTELEE